MTVGPASAGPLRSRHGSLEEGLGTRFVVRRLPSLVLTWILVSVIAFVVMHVTAGNPAAMMLGEQASPAEVARLSRVLGLDQPLPAQYLHWMDGVIHGNLGNSIYLGEPVLRAIIQRLPITLSLTIVALTMAIVVGVSAGILAALRQGSWVDAAVMTVATAGLSMPEFWIGLMLILVFAVDMHLLPLMGYVPFTANPVGWFEHIIMPAFAIGFIQSAPIARMTRSSLLDVLHADYMRTARAKGLGAGRVVLRHGLRNAAIPVITTLGIILAALISGAFVVETVFDIPGVGYMMLQAVDNRDYPVIQGGIMMIASAILVVNLLIDLCYSLVDPRVEFR